MVKIKFHPLFLIFACAMFYYGYGLLFVTYLLVLSFHEYAHYFVAKKLGYILKDVTLLPYGVALDGNLSIVKPKDEIKIAIAGPLMNAVLGILFMAIWWIFPESYAYTFDFVFANLVISVFNLIPAFPLDGGRILIALISIKKQRKIAFRIVRIISILMACSVFGLFILFIIQGELNYTLITAFLFMLSGVFYKNKLSIYTRNMYTNKHKRLNKGMEVKSIAVNGNIKLYNLNYILHAGFYNQVYVLGEDYKIVRILYEEDIEDAFSNYSANTELLNVLPKKNSRLLNKIYATKNI